MISKFTVTYNGLSKTFSTSVTASFLESIFGVSGIIGLELDDSLIIDLKDKDRSILSGREATLVFEKLSQNSQQKKSMTKQTVTRLSTSNVTITVEGDVFTLLMKGSNADFSFDSIHWTTNSVLNPESANNKFDGISVKTKDFNEKKISKLLLMTKNGIYTILGLPRNDLPLLYYFQNNNNTENLKVISGMAHPLHLAHGNVSTDGKIGLLQSYWRINAINCAYLSNNNNNGGKIFGARIGGFFTYTWGSNYGVDSLGNLCSAECCGCGITDTVYSPMTSGKKSFGVRQAHDSNALPGGGQITSDIHIYGL
ncbi:hypothetical protein ABK040_003825 [Willaertia magna]